MLPHHHHPAPPRSPHRPDAGFVDPSAVPQHPPVLDMSSVPYSLLAAGQSAKPSLSTPVSRVNTRPAPSALRMGTRGVWRSASESGSGSGRAGTEAKVQTFSNDASSRKPPITAQNASYPAQNASYPAQNASYPAQNASSPTHLGKENVRTAPRINSTTRLPAVTRRTGVPAQNAKRADLRTPSQEHTHTHTQGGASVAYTRTQAPVHVAQIRPQVPVLSAPRQTMLPPAHNTQQPIASAYGGQGVLHQQVQGHHTQPIPDRMTHTHTQMMQAPSSFGNTETMRPVEGVPVSGPDTHPQDSARSPAGEARKMMQARHVLAVLSKLSGRFPSPGGSSVSSVTSSSVSWALSSSPDNGSEVTALGTSSSEDSDSLASWLSEKSESVSEQPTDLRSFTDSEAAPLPTAKTRRSRSQKKKPSRARKSEQEDKAAAMESKEGNAAVEVHLKPIYSLPGADQQNHLHLASYLQTQQNQWFRQSQGRAKSERKRRRSSTRRESTHNRLFRGHTKSSQLRVDLKAAEWQRVLADESDPEKRTGEPGMPKSTKTARKGRRRRRKRRPRKPPAMSPRPCERDAHTRSPSREGSRGRGRSPRRSSQSPVHARRSPMNGSPDPKSALSTPRKSPRSSSSRSPRQRTPRAATPAVTPRSAKESGGGGGVDKVVHPPAPSTPSGGEGPEDVHVLGLTPVDPSDPHSSPKAVETSGTKDSTDPDAQPDTADTAIDATVFEHRPISAPKPLMPVAVDTTSGPGTPAESRTSSRSDSRRRRRSRSGSVSSGSSRPSSRAGRRTRSGGGRILDRRIADARKIAFEIKVDTPKKDYRRRQPLSARHSHTSSLGTPAVVKTHPHSTKHRYTRRSHSSMDVLQSHMDRPFARHRSRVKERSTSHAQPAKSDEEVSQEDAEEESGEDGTAASQVGDEPVDSAGKFVKRHSLSVPRPPGDETGGIGPSDSETVHPISSPMSDISAELREPAQVVTVTSPEQGSVSKALAEAIASEQPPGTTTVVVANEEPATPAADQEADASKTEGDNGGECGSSQSSDSEDIEEATASDSSDYDDVSGEGEAFDEPEGMRGWRCLEGPPEVNWQSLIDKFHARKNEGAETAFFNATWIPLCQFTEAPPPPEPWLVPVPGIIRRVPTVYDSGFKAPEDREYEPRSLEITRLIHHNNRKLKSAYQTLVQDVIAADRVPPVFQPNPDAPEFFADLNERVRRLHRRRERTRPADVVSDVEVFAYLLPTLIERNNQQVRRDMNLCVTEPASSATSTALVPVPVPTPMSDAAVVAERERVGVDNPLRESWSTGDALSRLRQDMSTTRRLQSLVQTHIDRAVTSCIEEVKQDPDSHSESDTSSETEWGAHSHQILHRLQKDRSFSDCVQLMDTLRVVERGLTVKARRVEKQVMDDFSDSATEQELQRERVLREDGSECMGVKDARLHSALAGALRDLYDGPEPLLNRDGATSGHTAHALLGLLSGPGVAQKRSSERVIHLIALVEQNGGPDAHTLNAQLPSPDSTRTSPVSALSQDGRMKLVGDLGEAQPSVSEQALDFLMQNSPSAVHSPPNPSEASRLVLEEDSPDGPPSHGKRVLFSPQSSTVRPVSREAPVPAPAVNTEIVPGNKKSALGSPRAEKTVRFAAPSLPPNTGSEFKQNMWEEIKSYVQTFAGQGEENDGMRVASPHDMPEDGMALLLAVTPTSSDEESEIFGSRNQEDPATPWHEIKQAVETRVASPIATLPDATKTTTPSRPSRNIQRSADDELMRAVIAKTDRLLGDAPAPTRTARPLMVSGGTPLRADRGGQSHELITRDALPASVPVVKGGGLVMAGYPSLRRGKDVGKVPSAAVSTAIHGADGTEEQPMPHGSDKPEPDTQDADTAARRSAVTRPSSAQQSVYSLKPAKDRPATVAGWRPAGRLVMKSRTGVDGIAAGPAVPLHSSTGQAAESEPAIHDGDAAVGVIKPSSPPTTSPSMEAGSPSAAQPGGTIVTLRAQTSSPPKAKPVGLTLRPTGNAKCSTFRHVLTQPKQIPSPEIASTAGEDTDAKSSDSVVMACDKTGDATVPSVPTTRRSSVISGSSMPTTRRSSVGTAPSVPATRRPSVVSGVGSEDGGLFSTVVSAGESSPARESSPTRHSTDSGLGSVVGAPYDASDWGVPASINPGGSSSGLPGPLSTAGALPSMPPPPTHAPMGASSLLDLEIERPKRLEVVMEPHGTGTEGDIPLRVHGRGARFPLLPLNPPVKPHLLPPVRVSASSESDEKVQQQPADADTHHVDPAVIVSVGPGGVSRYMAGRTADGSRVFSLAKDGGVASSALGWEDTRQSDDETDLDVTASPAAPSPQDHAATSTNQPHFGSGSGQTVTGLGKNRLAEMKKADSEPNDVPISINVRKKRGGNVWIDPYELETEVPVVVAGVSEAREPVNDSKPQTLEDVKHAQRISAVLQCVQEYYGGSVGSPETSEPPAAAAVTTSSGPNVTSEAHQHQPTDTAPLVSWAQKALCMPGISSNGSSGSIVTTGGSHQTYRALQESVRQQTEPSPLSSTKPHVSRPLGRDSNVVRNTAPRVPTGRGYLMPGGKQQPEEVPSPPKTLVDTANVVAPVLMETAPRPGTVAASLALLGQPAHSSTAHASRIVTQNDAKAAHIGETAAVDSSDSDRIPIHFKLRQQEDVHVFSPKPTAKPDPKLQPLPVTQLERQAQWQVRAMGSGMTAEDGNLVAMVSKDANGQTLPADKFAFGKHAKNHADGTNGTMQLGAMRALCEQHSGPVVPVAPPPEYVRGSQLYTLSTLAAEARDAHALQTPAPDATSASLSRTVQDRWDRDPLSVPRVSFHPDHGVLRRARRSRSAMLPTGGACHTDRTDRMDRRDVANTTAGLKPVKVTSLAGKMAHEGVGAQDAYIPGSDGQSTASLHSLFQVRHEAMNDEVKKRSTATQKWHDVYYRQVVPAVRDGAIEMQKKLQHRLADNLSSLLHIWYKSALTESLGSSQTLLSQSPADFEATTDAEQEGDTTVVDESSTTEPDSRSDACEPDQMKLSKLMRWQSQIAGSLEEIQKWQMHQRVLQTLEEQHRKQQLNEHKKIMAWRQAEGRRTATSSYTFPSSVSGEHAADVDAARTHWSASESVSGPGLPDASSVSEQRHRRLLGRARTRNRDRERVKMLAATQQVVTAGEDSDEDSEAEEKWLDESVLALRDKDFRTSVLLWAFNEGDKSGALRWMKRRADHHSLTKKLGAPEDMDWMELRDVYYRLVGKPYELQSFDRLQSQLLVRKAELQEKLNLAAEQRELEEEAEYRAATDVEGRDEKQELARAMRATLDPDRTVMECSKHAGLTHEEAEKMDYYASGEWQKEIVLSIDGTLSPIANEDRHRLQQRWQAQIARGDQLRASKQNETLRDLLAQQLYEARAEEQYLNRGGRIRELSNETPPDVDAGAVPSAVSPEVIDGELRLNPQTGEVIRAGVGEDRVPSPNLPQLSRYITTPTGRVLGVVKLKSSALRAGEEPGHPASPQSPDMPGEDQLYATILPFAKSPERLTQFNEQVVAMSPKTYGQRAITRGLYKLGGPATTTTQPSGVDGMVETAGDSQSELSSESFIIPPASAHVDACAVPTAEMVHSAASPLRPQPGALLNTVSVFTRPPGQGMAVTGLVEPSGHGKLLIFTKKPSLPPIPPALKLTEEAQIERFRYRFFSKERLEEYKRANAVKQRRERVAELAREAQNELAFPALDEWMGRWEGRLEAVAEERDASIDEHLTEHFGREVLSHEDFAQRSRRLLAVESEQNRQWFADGDALVPAALKKLEAVEAVEMRMLSKLHDALREKREQQRQELKRMHERKEEVKKLSGLWRATSKARPVGKGLRRRLRDKVLYRRKTRKAAAEEWGIPETCEQAPLKQFLGVWAAQLERHQVRRNVDDVRRARKTKPSTAGVTGLAAYKARIARMQADKQRTGDAFLDADTELGPMMPSLSASGDLVYSVQRKKKVDDVEVRTVQGIVEKGGLGSATLPRFLAMWKKELSGIKSGFVKSKP